MQMVPDRDIISRARRHAEQRGQVFNEATFLRSWKSRWARYVERLEAKHCECGRIIEGHQKNHRCKTCRGIIG